MRRRCKKFLAPVSEVSPFNDYAKKGLKDWTTYLGPTKDFDEMVFNLKPLSDQNGNTIAALVNKVLSLERAMHIL
ncbi:DUF4432 family protein [Acinetobacter nectaris]|uniref:DUF4432 family protein n=1 Tax=Acinetobacter nectaris TaxID=1219382 RepID=UPI003AFFB556|nr:DUF4432 family protein [Acinetobacter nectaris]MCF9027031.1 DUF4432 family protein [Acinetobacter nectaris]